MMIKRSVVVQGHATSVRLEPEFWQAVDAYCKQNNTNLSQLIVSLEKQQNSKSNLASLLRVFCLNQAFNPVSGDAFPTLSQ
jgi:predicted DNA-binding ribbon-helix-helix protein